MNAMPINGSPGVPAGEVAVIERVRQLQAMAEELRTGSLPSAQRAATSTSFASALAAAGAPGPSAYSASAPAAPGEPSSPSAYDGLIRQAASRYGIDPAILHGLIQQESAFNPASTSSAGAQGLTQLMPGTASSLGVRNPLDPAESIDGGARYLAGLLHEFGGNTEEALAAYNAGPGAVHAAGGIPPYPETQEYVTKVLGYARSYRNANPTLQGVPA